MYLDREIKIGEGDHGNGSIKCMISDKIKKIDVSENSVSYWVFAEKHIIPCDTIIIMKDTLEGKAITNILDRFKKKYEDKTLTGGDLVTMERKYCNTIDRVILNNLRLEQIRDGIEELKDEGHRQGVLDARKTIREALGLTI